MTPDEARRFIDAGPDRPIRSWTIAEYANALYVSGLADELHNEHMRWLGVIHEFELTYQSHRPQRTIKQWLSSPTSARADAIMAIITIVVLIVIVTVPLWVK